MPSFRSLVLWGLAGVGFITGIEFSATPNHEIAYKCSRIDAACFKGQCYTQLDVSVGNTGWNESNVSIEMNRELVDAVMLPLKVRNRAHTSQRFERTDSGSRTTLKLGEIKGGAELRVALNYYYLPGEIPPSCQDLEVAASSTNARVVKGHPRDIRFARLVNVLLSY